MLVNKIKVQKSGVTIVYEQVNKGESLDTITLVSDEDPKPAFEDALNSLGDDVINLCRLDPTGWDNIRITGLTLRRENDQIGVVITAQNKVEDLVAPLLINTPYFIADKYLTLKLEIVCMEAIDFIKGDRAQLQLFDTAPAKSKGNLKAKVAPLRGSHEQNTQALEA